MIVLITAISLTLIISGFCSLLEAFILSISTAEIQSLKKEAPRQGKALDQLKTDIEKTSSAILTLNTIANTLGATFVGYLAAKQFEKFGITVITVFMILGILILSEIIPKNIGTIYKAQLKKYLVYPKLNIKVKRLV